MATVHPLIEFGGAIVCGGFLAWNVAFTVHWTRTDFVPSLKKRRSVLGRSADVLWATAQFVGLPILLVVALSRVQLAIAFSVASAFAILGLFVRSRGRDEPNQSTQRNAGSRPSSDDSPVSESSPSLGPRG